MKNLPATIPENILYELIGSKWSEGIESHRRQGSDWQITLKGTPWTTRDPAASWQARRVVTLLFKLLGNTVRLGGPPFAWSSRSNIFLLMVFFSPTRSFLFVSTTGLQLRLRRVHINLLFRLPNPHLRLSLPLLLHLVRPARRLLPLRILLSRVPLLAVLERGAFDRCADASTSGRGRCYWERVWAREWRWR